MLANLRFGLFALGLAALLLLACETGFQLGRRAASRDIPRAFDEAAGWEIAVLGLAALLIGFTFEMAVSRYAARKQVLIEEANAIETAYQRTQLVDESVGRDVRRLMRRYLDLRIDLYDVGVDRARTLEIERESAELQRQIWARVAAVGRADPRSITTGLLLQSVNAIRERAAERRASREMPVPPTVFVVVILVAAFAVVSIGYSLGIAGKRMLFGMYVMPLLVGAVIMLVIDIALPGAGVVRVPDQPMLDLKEAL